MKLKPLSERRLDYQGRAQMNIFLHVDLVDRIQRARQTSAFAGTQTEFIETLLKRGLDAIDAERETPLKRDASR